ncbi:hypothetical protein ACX80W_13630 [Arthrobacter sp. TMN-37]
MAFFPDRGAAAPAALLGLALFLAGCGAGPGTSAGPGGPSASGPAPSASATARPTPAASATAGPTPSPEAPKPTELPRGGTDLFPAYRLMGYSGHPLSPGLGRLGIGDLDERVAEIEAHGAAYAGGRRILPVLELITVVVQAEPGPDGTYRTHTPDATIQQYLEAARRHDAILLLNIQPGRSSMTEEVKRLEKWLKEPDVGLALDPEWDITDQEVPGAVYGSTAGEEIEAIAAWLNDLVVREALPQKALVFHQVAVSVVPNEGAITAHPGVEVIKSADGIGSAGSKTEAYALLTAGLPATVRPGFKLFFEEEAAAGPLMTPDQVLALVPQPEYILYE